MKKIAATIHETDGKGSIISDDKDYPGQISIPAAALQQYPAGTKVILSASVILHQENPQPQPDAKQAQREARDAAIAAQDAAEDAAAHASAADATAKAAAAAAQEAAKTATAAN
jgi:hypothetical protein